MIPTYRLRVVLVLTLPINARHGKPWKGSWELPERSKQSEYQISHKQKSSESFEKQMWCRRSNKWNCIRGSNKSHSQTSMSGKTIHVTQYSPIGNQNEWYAKGKGLPRLTNHPVLVEIGKKCGKSSAQVALGEWLPHCTGVWEYEGIGYGVPARGIA